jgi:ribosomal protein S4E
MRNTIAIAMLTALLGVDGCNPDIKVLDGEIVYAPEGAIVEAIIKMPDGSIKKVNAKRWRQYKNSIAIETDDKEFMTSMDNVVMICEHPKKEGTNQ